MRSGDTLTLPLQGSGLATNALVRKSLCESLQTQVVIPRLGEAFVLLVKLDEMHVVVAHDVAAPLLDGNVIVMLIAHTISPKCFLPVSEGPGFVSLLGQRWRHGFVRMTIPYARATGYPR